MKLLVLGLDGLEPKIVVALGLRGLMQSRWGIHEASIIDSSLWTPIIWASFLMGERAEKEGFDTQQRYSIKALEKIYRLRKKFLPHLNLRLRSLLIRTRIVEDAYQMPKWMREKNIVGRLSKKNVKVEVHNFPTISPGWDMKRKRLWRIDRISELLTKGHSAVYKQAWDECIAELESIFSFAVKANYDLGLTWTQYPDRAQHVLFTRPRLIWRFYKLLNNFTSALSKRLQTKGVELLILSDHGWEVGTPSHSPRGFWSLSFNDPTARFRSITEVSTWLVQLFNDHNPIRKKHLGKDST